MDGGSRPRSHPAPGPLPAGQARDALVVEVAAALQALPVGARALVACSGGPDSTALAYLTAEARPDLGLELCMVRHGLRDDLADLAAVRAHGRFLGAPVRVVDVVVRDSGEGLEAAARAQRYAALRREAAAAGAGWILVGHTADDQAETLLLRLARGTGVGGMAGMPPVRGDLVRPLLRLRRSDVHRFVLHEGLESVTDPANRDPRFARTHARHELLPLLEALAPDPVGALGRLADLAREDARRLDADTRAIADATMRRYGPTFAVPADVLGALDPALARRLARELVLRTRSDDLPPSAAHVAAILELEPGGAADLPDVTVTCGGGWVAAAPAGLAAAATSELVRPGVTPWPAAGVEIVSSVPGAGARGDPVQLALDVGVPWTPPSVAVPDEALPPGSDPGWGQLVLAADVAAGHRLVVRSRRPGDRLRGSAGSRKLQDALVDAGVPRAVRDIVPVVVRVPVGGEDASGDVLWVPGVGADAEAAAAGIARPGLHLAVGLLQAPARR